MNNAISPEKFQDIVFKTYRQALFEGIQHSEELVQNQWWNMDPDFCICEIASSKNAMTMLTLHIMQAYYKLHFTFSMQPLVPLGMFFTLNRRHVQTETGLNPRWDPVL